MEYSIFGLLLSFPSRFIYTKMFSSIRRKKNKKKTMEQTKAIKMTGDKKTKYLKAADHLQVIINVLVQSLNQRLLLIATFQYNSFNTRFYYKRRINQFSLCFLWTSKFSILGTTIVFLMSLRYWKWFKALRYKGGFKLNINVWSNIRKNVSFFFITIDSVRLTFKK